MQRAAKLTLEAIGVKMRQILISQGVKRMPEDEMLTADEVAKIMKVNIRTVRQWVANGEIAVVSIGKREYRIARSALNKFIQDRQGRKGMDDEK